MEAKFNTRTLSKDIVNLEGRTIGREGEQVRIVAEDDNGLLVESTVAQFYVEPEDVEPLPRPQVRLKFRHQGGYGSITCNLDNAEMIASHYYKDGCSRVWIG